MSSDAVVTMGEACALADTVALAKPGASTVACCEDVLKWETRLEKVS